MQTIELIHRLEAIVREHGDLPVASLHRNLGLVRPLKNVHVVTIQDEETNETKVCELQIV